MAERQRRGPLKNVIKWAKQFSDPKFNPERRTAMQMLAAAPAAGKLKLAGGALSPQFDAPAFYETLMSRLASGNAWREYAPMMFHDPEDRASIAKQLYRDLWDNARGIRKDAEYGEISAYDNLMEGDHLSDALIEGGEPFMGGDKELWDKAVRAFHDAGDGTDDALNELSQEATSEYVNSLDPESVVSEFGSDDAYSGYFDARNIDTIQDTLDEEMQRLGLDPVANSTAREELAKRLHLPEFLEQAQQLGQAAEDDYLDIESIPDWQYMDPEALRYASMRNLLEHPVLSPNELMKVTGADPMKALAGLPDRMAETLFQRVRPYPPMGQSHEDTIRMAQKGEPWVQPVLRPEQALDWSRVHPSVREGLSKQIDEWLVNPRYSYSGPQFFDALRSTRRHLAETMPEEFMSHEDLPSYIGNRSSPFRVKFNKADAGKKSVAEPLSYMDVIRALPPEEYAEGGYVE